MPMEEGECWRNTSTRDDASNTEQRAMELGNSVGLAGTGSSGWKLDVPMGYYLRHLHLVGTASVLRIPWDWICHLVGRAQGGGTHTCIAQ